ncbi:MAG: ABC transporter ATP-binding protein, partial [Fulvivirga sp.]|nr:ABC transporter ATP-binding protein [Fulvivirga sp.]
RAEFEAFKDKYRNEAIAEIVKNQNEQHRIIESDGHLIQKIFPIYKDPYPESLLDYRSQFYVPKKHFLGRYFDTLHFNLGVIWFMSIVLTITLYFDVPRKVVNMIENAFTRRKV